MRMTTSPGARQEQRLSALACLLVAIIVMTINACSGISVGSTGAPAASGGTGTVTSTSATGAAPGLVFQGTSVSVATTVVAPIAPRAVVAFTLTTPAGDTGSIPLPDPTWSGAAIRDVSVTLVPQPSTSTGDPSYQGSLTVSFWPGSALGAGQYAGTVGLTICTAGGTSTCSNQASASIAATLAVSGAVSPSTVLVPYPSELDIVSPVTSSAAVGATLQLALSQPSPAIYMNLSQPSAPWIATLGYQSSGNQAGIVTLTLLPASQMIVGVHQGVAQLSACLDQQCVHPLRNSPVTVPVTYRVTPLAALSRWYQGGFDGKKVVVWGNSTVSNALYFFQQFDSFTRAGGPLAGLNPSNVLNFGNNGASLAALLAGQGPHPIEAVIAAQPDLLIMRGPLINDVRLGQTDLAQAEQLLIDALDRITAGSPNTDILLTTENSLLTTDVDGYHYVQPNSAAQPYTDILHDAVLAMSGRYPHVAVYDIMALEYGTTCQPSSPLMANQLHPNQAGQTEEADLDVKVVGLPLLTN
jgi:hypothetical protein